MVWVNRSNLYESAPDGYLLALPVRQRSGLVQVHRTRSCAHSSMFFFFAAFFSLLLFFLFFFPREFVGKIVMSDFQVLCTEYYNVYLHQALGPSTIVRAALQPNLQRGSEYLEIPR